MKTKSENLNKRLAEIREKVAKDTGDESLDAYLEGFSDGYDKAKAELIEELAKEWFEGKKKSNSNALEELLKEWSEKQE